MSADALRAALEQIVVMCQTGMPEYDARDIEDVARAALAQRAGEPVAYWAQSVHGKVFSELPGGMGLKWRPLVEPSIGGRCASGDVPYAKPEPQRFPSQSEQPLAAGLNQAAPAAPAYVPLSDDGIDVERPYVRGATSTAAQWREFARAVEALVVARMRVEGK